MDSVGLCESECESDSFTSAGSSEKVRSTGVVASSTLPLVGVLLGDFLEGVGDFLEGVGDFLEGVGDFLEGVGDFLDGVDTFLEGGAWVWPHERRLPR